MSRGRYSVARSLAPQPNLKRCSMSRRPMLLILSEVRTGGTVLFNALGRHSRLQVAGELFNFSKSPGPWRPRMEDLARSAGMTVPTGPRCDVIPMFRGLYLLNTMGSRCTAAANWRSRTRPGSICANRRITRHPPAPAQHAGSICFSATRDAIWSLASADRCRITASRVGTVHNQRR